MSPQVENAKNIFLEAVEKHTADQWPGYLDQACEGDSALRDHVEALLRAHGEPNRMLDGERFAPTLDQPPFEQPGTMIGSYKLIEEIGEGGMGTIFMALQQEPVRRKVALKVIKPGMDSKQVVSRFEAELQALAMMDHPNIAKVHDGGATESGRPYFVMELVNGIPITDYCDRYRLTTNDRLKLFEDVCRAVQHAHQKGIIHRDLKPSNILVTLLDGRAVPKVIDFGIAKATRGHLTEESLVTHFTQMIGSPLYMSPEQAELSGADVDTRSDVYSLGVLLYELLTGNTPFDQERMSGVSFDELRRIVREEDPPRPSIQLSTLDAALVTVADRHHTDPQTLSHEVAGELDWIVMKALDKDRTQRYESASALAADIQHHLNDEPVEACPPSRTYRFRKFARRNRVVLSMIAVVSAALLLGIVGTTWQAIRATRAERDAVTERDRALDAEQTARDEAARADIEAANARTEAAIAQAVNEFINEDLLGSADPHAEPNRDLKVREVLDRSSKDIEGRFEDQPLVKAQILHTLGKTYHALGEYEKGGKLDHEALEIQRRILGKEHPSTLGSMNNLARAIADQGRYEEAEELHREVLEMRRRVLGPEHPDTLTSMYNLAGAIKRQDRLEESENLDRDVLEIRRRVLGPEHPHTLKSMCSLAIGMTAQGRYDEAERLSQEALKVQRRVLGEGHPDTLISLSSLAITMQLQGRFAEVEKLHAEVLEIRRRLLGREHPRTLVTMHNLANAIFHQDRYEEAERLHRDVLEIRRRVLGPEHPDTLKSMRGLTNALIPQGKYAEGAAQLTTVLALEPKDHRPWRRLAQCHLALGNKQEYEKACRSMIEQFPKPDQRSIADWGHIGQALYRTGRYEDARKALEKVIELRGDEGPTMYLGSRWWYYMMTLCQVGESDRARAYFEQLLQLMKEDPPANKELYDRLRNEAAELLGIELKSEKEEKEQP